MADDALRCIEALLETLPAWMEELQTISNTASATQEEILFANQPASEASQAPSKTSSLKSKRSTGAGEGDGQLRPQLKHVTNSDALRLSQRKRKTASVCSGSGPIRSRTKVAIAVYYDGETQKRFEKLVKAIGSSRNAIRKGKMSAKVDMLSRTSSSSSEASNSSGSEDGDFSNISLGCKSKNTRPRLPASGLNDGSKVFDTVDGRLEKAQSLCEKAAHQILRDGNCILEINSVNEHFTEALRLAEAGVPGLRNKAQRAAARRRRSEERHRLEEEEAEQERHGPSPIPTPEVKTAAAHITFPSEGKLEVDELEVDDGSDDDNEGDFDISNMRFGKFAQIRSTRLAVH